MAIEQYTEDTIRLARIEQPTERLAQPARLRVPIDYELFHEVSIQARFLAVWALILLGAWLAQRVDSQVFSIIAACVVAAVVWLAFGRRGE